MIAEILCVGTELLLGDVLNTNSTFIARNLAALGIDVYRQHVVGDNKERLQDVLKSSFENSELIILTGGLGPTSDDITKEVVADFLELKMQLDENVLDLIKKIFESKCCVMTDNNIKQALIPEGSIVVQNHNGTAPGIIIEKNQKTVILLPGPPQEMEPMFKNQIEPYLKKKSGRVIVSKNIHIFGIGESAVEEKLCDLMKNLKNPTLAPYAKNEEVLLRVTCSDTSFEDALNKIDPVINTVIERIDSDYIYGVDVGSLQNVAVRMLLEQNLKVATAESCTGGLISKRITDVPGSSGVFELGVCAYANRIKENVLGVRKQTLDRFGAVSKETAIEMASGIRKISGADIGISSTGIAGPGGSVEGKPVGLVYVAISSDLGTEVIELNLGSVFYNENQRENIRYVASSHALHLLLKLLKERGNFLKNNIEENIIM